MPTASNSFGLGNIAGLLAALAGQLRRLLLVVVFIVFVFDELSGHRRLHLWHSTANCCSSVGRALMISGVRRLVDQGAVGLVDQGEVRRALHRLLV